MAGPKGIAFVISAPSGCGKTTLTEKLIRKIRGLRRSISVTSRKPRAGEVDGRDYIFVDEIDFERAIKKGEFLEWVRYSGNYYGTPKKAVESLLRAGNDVALNLDVHGARAVKKAFKDAATIFVIPPSIEDLKARLKGRNTDHHFEIKRRIEIAEKELSHLPEYDYAVVNDKIEDALKKLKAIITAERCRIRSEGNKR